MLRSTALKATFLSAILTLVVHAADPTCGFFDKYPLFFLVAEPFAAHPNIFDWRAGLSTHDVQNLIRVHKPLNTTINRARDTIIEKFPQFDFSGNYKNTMLFRYGEWICFGKLKSTPSSDIKEYPIQLLFGDQNNIWRYGKYKIGGRPRIYTESTSTQQTQHRLPEAVFRFKRGNKLIYVVPANQTITTCIFTNVPYKAEHYPDFLPKTVKRFFPCVIENPTTNVTYDPELTVVPMDYGVKPVEYTVTVDLGHSAFADIRKSFEQIQTYFEKIKSNQACECSSAAISSICYQNYSHCWDMLVAEEAEQCLYDDLDEALERWHRLQHIGKVPGIVYSFKLKKNDSLYEQHMKETNDKHLERKPNELPSTVYTNPFGEVIIFQNDKKSMLTHDYFEKTLKSINDNNSNLTPREAVLAHAAEFKLVDHFLSRTIGKTVYLFNLYKKTITSVDFDATYTVENVEKRIFKHNNTKRFLLFMHLKSTTNKDLAKLCCIEKQGIAHNKKNALWYDIELESKEYFAAIYVGEALEKYSVFHSFSTRDTHNALVQETFNFMRTCEFATTSDKEKCVIS